MRSSVFVVLVSLLVLTQGLIFYHNSGYVKREYDKICDAIYDEQVWIDKCYVPFYTEGTTLETFRNVELMAIAGSLLLYLKKFYVKN